MITPEMYFGEKPHSAEEADAAADMLHLVNTLLQDVGWDYPNDPDTGTPISGSKNGAGDGGFRLPDSATGKPKSQHKRAHALDVYDPRGELDELLTDEVLAAHGLYREHPNATPGWCHLQNVPPHSGKRTFYP